MKVSVQNPRLASMLAKANKKAVCKSNLRSSNPIRFYGWAETELFGQVAVYDRHTTKAIMDAYKDDAVIGDLEIEALASFDGFYANTKTGNHPAKLSDACVEDYVFHFIKRKGYDLVFYAEYRYQ